MKLDIGCGDNKVSQHHVGLDKIPLPGVDIVLDLESASLPFETNSVDEVCCYHVLEHISNLVALMEELYRVMKPSAILHVRVPNSTHASSLADPTHVRFFNSKSFDFYDPNSPIHRESGWYGTIARYEVEKINHSDSELEFCLYPIKKRIALISPAQSIHTKRWTNSLRQVGHSVTVFARMQKGVASIPLSSGCTDKEEDIEAMTERARGEFEGFDLCHAHYSTKYGHVLEAAPATARKILSIWGEDILREPATDIKLKQRLLRAISAADEITTTSPEVRTILEREYGVDSNQVWVFAWGVDKCVFCTGQSRAGFLKKHNIPANKPLVLSARACKPINNIDAIIRSFVNIKSDGLLVVCTGDIRDKSYTDRLREDFESETVRFVPPLTEIELADFYRAAEATVSIPAVDQLSSTVLESMSCGTPVIGSDIEPYRTRIVHGQNGLLIDSTDGEAIEIALAQALSGDLKEVLGCKAQSAVANDSWVMTVRNMIFVYDRMSVDRRWRMNR